MNKWRNRNYKLWTCSLVPQTSIFVRPCTALPFGCVCICKNTFSWTKYQNKKKSFIRKYFSILMKKKNLQMFVLWASLMSFYWFSAYLITVNILSVKNSNFTSCLLSALLYLVEPLESTLKVVFVAIDILTLLFHSILREKMIPRHVYKCAYFCLSPRKFWINKRK